MYSDLISLLDKTKFGQLEFTSLFQVLLELNHSCPLGNTNLEYVIMGAEQWERKIDVVPMPHRCTSTGLFS